MRSCKNYKGMRFYKCDLHLHTPEDAKNWSDDSCKLASPRIEEDLQAKARQYLERCHELELECIGISDHNFSVETDSRKWFLTHLIEQNHSVAEHLGREPLVIFPGFELDIRYHLVCLFEPVRKGRDLQVLSDVLASMGLTPNKRYIGGVFKQPMQDGGILSLRQVIDKVQGEHKGIIIAAHAFSDDGICNDTSNIDDFVSNHKLYAVEVKGYPLETKAQQILSGQNREWKRSNGTQPAAICSSDGKSLQNESKSNKIGYRHSWIKMSAPSIESLRQAFLDHNSRIRLEREPFETTHTHIKEIILSGTTFLADQQISFSPHLNCIIGGRGSGKSMLFESLRLGLRGEQGYLGREQKSAVKKQVLRVQGTFTSETSITVKVAHHGLEDTFVVDQKGIPSRIQRNVEKSEIIFRQLDALFFSQDEITQLADEHRSLLGLFDSLAREKLDQYRNKAATIIEEIKVARQQFDRAKLLKAQLDAIKQERDELTRQLKVQTTIQDELKKHQSAQEALQYLQSLEEQLANNLDPLYELSESFKEKPTALGSRVDRFPTPDVFKNIEQRLSAAYHNLSQAIHSAADTLQKEFASIVYDNREVQQARQAIKEVEKSFQQSLERLGITEESAEQLRRTEQELRLKNVAVESKEREFANSERESKKGVDLLVALSECWRSEYEERGRLLQTIMSSETMPHTANGSPVVGLKLDYASDREHFLELWSSLAPQRNTRIGRYWDRYLEDIGNGNIGDQLFNAFQAALKTGFDSGVIKDMRGLGNPFMFLNDILRKNNDDLPPLIEEYKDGIKKALEEKKELWRELLVTKVRDLATLTLFRNDGSEAGRFDDNSLSSGQKNTAILSLLLSHGQGPVLIDQPEDELDSEFLYGELVPLIRKAKVKRQLIIVTHNANIPVNGDAELIYALKATGGRGVCISQGGLDNSSVAKDVLDIMEGSEEAFKKRQAKYHF